MIKKLLVVLSINTVITIFLFYISGLLTIVIAKFYEGRDIAQNYRSWIGFMVMCLFLLNLLIAYLVLNQFKIVKLMTVLMVLGGVILVRVILNFYAPTLYIDIT